MRITGFLAYTMFMRGETRSQFILPRLMRGLWTEIPLKLKRHKYQLLAPYYPQYLTILDFDIHEKIYWHIEYNKQKHFDKISSHTGHKYNSNFLRGSNKSAIGRSASISGS